MNSETILSVVKIVLGGVRLAIAGDDNEMVTKGLDLADTVLGTAETAIELDSEIGERVRAFADEIEAKREAGDLPDRDEFTEAAASVRDAVSRWNAAG